MNKLLKDICVLSKINLFRVTIALRSKFRPIRRMSRRFLRDAKGIYLYLKNIWTLKVRKPNQIMFYGHLGMGDQICYAKLYEKWSDQGKVIHVPCKESYFPNLSSMFQYIPNLIFHRIPSESSHEKLAVKVLQDKLRIPLVVSGHETLQIMRMIHPRDGGQSSLIRTAGLVVNDLYSPSFRANILTLPQKRVPEYDYAFLNLRNSKGRFELPMSPPWNKSLPVIEEDGVSPLYAYAKIIDEAREIRSIGSSFMCMAIVMGSRAPSKFFINNIGLNNDDPLNEWVSVNL